MAVGDWWEHGGLRSLFGTIQQAASQGLNTADVWGAIRDAAYNIAQHTLGITSPLPPTESEITGAASDLLSGISATMVSQARGAAGQLNSAHDNLLAQDPNEQIEADSIGRPPWSQTSNVAGISEQYRLRVYREIEVRGFTTQTIQEWGTYDLTGPLTSVSKALDDANSLFAQADYNRSASITSILDYTIETI
jgi:hypothetical protein